MSTSMVDNFPGFPEGIMGPQLMANMRKQAEKFGTEIIKEEVRKVDFKSTPFKVLVSGQWLMAKSVVIATGALTQWLGVPGEKELVGRGVSTCASCDAPFFRNKVVAVVGGGDSAMEEASVLTKYASQVYLIHRRDSFKASEAMQKKVLNNPKIKILWNTEIKRVIGVGKVERVEMVNNKTKETSQLAMDGIFIAIGHKPNSEIFKQTDLPAGRQVEMDENGFIKVKGGHSITSVKGVFVAGDVMDPYYKQAITSAGSGCAAALEVLKYLDETK